MCYEMIELKEGEPVVFLGVHALRWNWQEWGVPKFGFINCNCHQKVEELQAENERLRKALEWYANEDGYMAAGHTDVIATAYTGRMGAKAKQALKESE